MDVIDVFTFVVYISCFWILSMLLAGAVFYSTGFALNALKFVQTKWALFSAVTNKTEVKNEG